MTDAEIDRMQSVLAEWEKWAKKFEKALDEYIADMDRLTGELAEVGR